MKKLFVYGPLVGTLLGLVIVFYGATRVGGHGGGELTHISINLEDHAAIQSGAKYFANYCMGCHSAEHMRYKQLTKVGLSEQDVLDNLVFDGSKIGNLMKIAMPKGDAANWFGAAAPDLTLTARLKHGGASWIYSYLKGFYTDPSRPMGVNNTIFPNVGMPNILWELQGVQEAVYQYNVTHDGHAVESFATEAEAAARAREMGEGYKLEKIVESLEITQPGELSPEEFDKVARDIATYMAYIAEPVKTERQGIGVWVLLFLAVFSVVAYFMKKEWWKDIH